MNEEKPINECSVCQDKANVASNWGRMNRLGTSAMRIAARCEALYQEGKWPTPLAEADRKYLANQVHEIEHLLSQSAQPEK